MGKLSIFIFLTILASVYNQCTIPTAHGFFKRSVYNFTLKLASRISQYTDSHFIASGLSPWSLISTLSLGATGDTLAEIVRVLRMYRHPCFKMRYNQIIRILMNITNEPVLEHSSVILIDDSLGVTENFYFNVTRTLVCIIEVLPFYDAMRTAAYVNDLVSQKTHKAIDQIVTANDIAGSSILLVDAFYFKGAWKIQFPYSNTEVSPFYNDKGNQIGDVNMMFVNGFFNITFVPHIQAKVLQIPYGEDNRFSMLFYLPYTNVTVDNLIENLNVISIRSIFSLFKRHQPRNVSVKIPRFKISSNIDNWKELLIDIGLEKMFYRNAKFDVIGSSPNLYVSNLIQKANVEVTEFGMGTSNVSEVEFESRMLPDRFIANKPFLFIIVDRESEFPLFIGAYSTPSIF